jgi:hypothetical protein
MHAGLDLDLDLDLDSWLVEWSGGAPDLTPYSLGGEVRGRNGVESAARPQAGVGLAPDTRGLPVQTASMPVSAGYVLAAGALFSVRYVSQ